MIETAALADALDAVLAAGARSGRTRTGRSPRTLLERVLGAAAQAPSPHHSFPWRLAVLTGPRPRPRWPTRWARSGAPICSADGLGAAEIEVELEKSRRRLIGSPVVLVGSVYPEPLDEYPDAARQQAETLMAAHSLGAALQNVMLAAHANGLQAAGCARRSSARTWCATHWGCDERLIPHAIVTIGYPARPPRARERPSARSDRRAAGLSAAETRPAAA